MPVDEFTEEFTRIIARIGGVVVALVLIYYLLSSMLRLERDEIVGIIREAITTSVTRIG
jgi:hypothetical protein